MKKRRGRRALDLRLEAQRRRLVRMVFCGWSQEKIARKMGCTARSIRNQIASPAFQDNYAKYESEQMAIVDRSMPRLLLASIDALHRLLTHKDWRAQEAGLNKVLMPYGRVLERLLDQRRQDPPGTVRMLPPMDDMTDEMRAKARDLLNIVRHTRPNLIEKIQEEPRAED